jgi:hypothetical protein
MTHAQLVTSHLDLIPKAIRRFTRLTPTSSAWDDAYSDAMLALDGAARAFDPSRGCLFVTLAWPRLKRAVQRVSIRSCGRDIHETTRMNFDASGNGLEVTVGEVVAGRDAPLVASPEDQLIAQEEAAEVERRMARLPAAERERVEALLDGRSLAVASTLVRLTKVAGFEDIELPALKKQSGRARSKVWLANLSPLKRAERAQKRRERRQAQKVAA